jgi:uncharacterized membrane protein
MSHRLLRAAGRCALWSVATLLSLLVVVVAAGYFRFDPSTYFTEQRSVYLAHRLPLYVHIGGACLALATAPWQLSRALRRRLPRLHRATGRVYVAGVMVGGVGGLAMAPLSYGGPVAHLGFAVLALAWLTTTGLGLAAVRRGDLDRHRRWMVRSFALTFAAVTLRLYLGTYLGLQAAGLAPVAYSTAYAAIAWLAWVPNLALAWRLTSRPPRVMRTPGSVHEDESVGLA